MRKESYTYTLFARPSFIEGVARIWDFGNGLNRYNASDSEKEADAKALYADWLMVGEDIKKGMEVYEQQR